ncbi:MAG: tail fiber domain-containing protein, partial [Candidatus Saccharimonas sp.]|nr:tail fiber domain-containing protein [Planctomycetaceae bacterium]
MFTTLPTSRFPQVAAACAGLFCLGLCRVGHTSDISGPVVVISTTDPYVELRQEGNGMAIPQYSWTVEADEIEFSVRDLSAGQFPFQIQAGSLSNSIRIGNNRQIGIGTDNPLRDLHVATTTNTQTIRLEGTSQTWDIEADNLGFELVNDPDGSNTRPLFVGINGSVGIGTSSPDASSRVDIRSSILTNGLIAVRSDNGPHFMRVETPNGVFRSGVQGNGDAQFGALTAGKGLNLIAGGATKLLMNSTGQITFGNAPTAITDKALVHQSGAHLTLGGVWTSISSRAAKQDIEPITSEQARDTVRALQPVGFRYKNELDEHYVGFIAEDVPELVATNDRKGLAPMDITAVLTKVVQDQSVQLDEQKTQLEDQRTAMAKQRVLNQRLEQLLDEQRKQANEQQTTLATLLK